MHNAVFALALLASCALAEQPPSRWSREIKDKTGAAAKCVNGHVLCQYWAKQGFCYKKKDFMDKQCQAACNPDCYCLGKEEWKEPLNCINRVPYCEFWARQGACSLYKDYMHWKCQKACDPRCKPQFKFTIHSIEKP